MYGEPEHGGVWELSLELFLRRCFFAETTVIAALVSLLPLKLIGVKALPSDIQTLWLSLYPSSSLSSSF